MAPQTHPAAAAASAERQGVALLSALRKVGREGATNLAWLEAHAPALFKGSLGARSEAGIALATGLGRLARDRQLVLLDREDELVIARLDVPGSIVETLQSVQQRGISCAEMFHSDEPVPGLDRPLEIQRYAFGRRPADAGAAAPEAAIPERLRRDVLAGAEARTPPVPPREARRLLELLWGSGELAIRRAGAGQLVQLVWLLDQCEAHQGVFLAAEERGDGATDEAHVLFALRGPPQRDFIAQVMEVFNALDLGVRRSFALTVATGAQPVFVGSFHLLHRKGETIVPGSPIFRRLRGELHNTQILNTDSPAYRDFVLARVMTGEEASLVNAFIGFSHTNCAHNQPTRYTFEDVVRAFHSHPDISLRLVRLFELRFDPEVTDREARWARESAEVERELAAYNTGHRGLDEFRRSLFRTALAFVRRTLKTNFYVAEKHALAFRLDPAYLADLGPDFTADLPPERPFRITFFCTRNGVGYHIGFSDIARGGWRTVLTQSRDDYVTVANTVFRENYVLAHTQHLKNKDIYEGGSKLVFVLRVPDHLKERERIRQLLQKVQYGLASAFLDLFVTRDGVARNPRVVDYYREDEPIEIGPDENMHDEMIEAIAALSVRRGYVLGTGIMSSKAVGINHKQYGVTSTGVVAFAEIALRERGVDISRDRFSVKLTGGPNGDVAGNGLRILLERCPGVQVRLIVDGTAALVDPAGLDRTALSAIVLRADAEAFDPARLSPGGFVLFRNVRRTEGLRELYRRVEMTGGGLRESWVTVDEFHAEFDALLFTVEADLFIPAGGRPETIDGTNWKRFLREDGRPSAATVVEGANSFLTPEARRLLQQAGVVILRDASANKCGVISSSYEIIGNLLMNEKEFLAHKEDYVRDVLAILARRARDEASLIFRRHREEGGKRSYTELSDAVSLEINAQKARLFQFFEAHPEAWRRPAYRRALLAHLPALVRDTPQLRQRVRSLPSKYRSAMLAAEIATTMVYRKRFEPSYEAALEEYATEMFPGGETGSE